MTRSYQRHGEGPAAPLPPQQWPAGVTYSFFNRQFRYRICIGGSREVYAKPALDLRPSLKLIDVIVRYILRAPQRYNAKSHLFEALVDQLKDK